MNIRELITVFVAGNLLLAFLACGPADRGPGSADEFVQKREEVSGVHPTVEWVLACRVPGRGFGCFPGDSSFVSRTGMAVEVLDRMGELDRLDGRDELVAWLRGMQQEDGGFLEGRDFFNGKQLPWGTMSALESTYWAVRTLRLLGSEPARPGAAAEFIRARQRESGVFDAYEVSWGGAREAVYSTWWAVAALRALGEAVPDSAQVIRWARDMQDTNERRGGFRLSVDNFNYATVSGTYYAVRILDLLGASPARPAHVKRFLLSEFGQEPDGGFELGHGDNWNNFDHYSLTRDTWFAVRSLDVLGMPLKDTDISRAARPRTDCVAWLASVQNPDGGFARVGQSDQTPLSSPSEMKATWCAVNAQLALGADVSRPESPVTPPVSEVQPHVPAFRHPTMHNDDPAEVWAYRRIALPVYSHYLEKTGSRIAALGWLMRWVRAVVGPENAVYLTGGRGLLHQGWGQCGEMSLLLQQLASSVDHAARYSFVIGDVNCELRVREEGWDTPHWCLYIPFTNEYPDPSLPTPEGELNGWSVLDVIVSWNRRHRNLNYPSMTELGDHLFESVRIETIDYDKGTWGHEVRLDTTSTYESPEAAELYPGKSW